MRYQSQSSSAWKEALNRAIVRMALEHIYSEYYSSRMKARIKNKASKPIKGHQSIHEITRKLRDDTLW